MHTNPGHIDDQADPVSYWFRTVNGPLCSYIRRRIGSAEDAEEICQEAFLRLHLTIRSARPINAPRPWLFRVAYRLMLDRLENTAARRLGEVPLELATDSLISPEDDPEILLLARSRAALLVASMKTLTATERRCVELRLRGRRLREIGDAQRVDLRRVNETLTRAARKLRERLT